MSFTGFTPAATRFFADLAANQDRAWFAAHKDVYETAVKAPMAALVAALVAELERRKIPLTADPAKAMFRIHRDVRFSRDKAPYKTHAGAVLTRDGRKDNPGLLYLHLDPQGSFAAAGFYHLEPAPLARVREAIAWRADEFQALEAHLHGAGLDFSRDEALARLPRGFDQHAASPVAHALRLRNLVVSRHLAPKALAGAALVGTIADFAAAALPLLEFGWDALD